MVAPCLPSFLPSCNGIALRCVFGLCLVVLVGPWLVGLPRELFVATIVNN